MSDSNDAARCLGVQSTPSPSPLSGYLNKLSGRGPLKGFKRRWFVYDANNCKLYFYRTRDDHLPLGEIDIRRATFSLPWPNKNPAVFNIVSFDKEFTLEAADRNSCIHWLHQLQKLRRNYIVDLADKFGVKLAKFDDCDYQTGKELDLTDGTSSSENTSIFYDMEGDSNKCTSVVDETPVKIKNEDLLVLTTHSPATRHRIFPNVFGKIKKQEANIPSSPGRKKSDKPDNRCLFCKEKEEQIISLSDDYGAVENELQASREVIKLLQQQLEIVNNEKYLLQDIFKRTSNLPNNDYLDVIGQKNEEVTKIKIDLRQMELNSDCLKNELHKLQSENEKYRQQIAALQEIVESRDKTVVSLTNEIFDLETERKVRQSSDPASVGTSGIRLQTSELESLKDTVKAFEIQNEFLNKEIVELNELRNVVEMKEHQSQVKISDLEAKCSQIQSKLLTLLKEIKQNAKTADESGKDGQTISQVINENVLMLVNRLLEETSLDIPLSWRPGNNRNRTSSNTSRNIEYDDLGFYFKNNFDLQDMDILSSKTESMWIKNEENRDAQEIRSNAAWKAKWDMFVGNLNNHEFSRSQELKSLLRSGIPQEYRGKIWKGLIYLRLKGKYQLGADYYQNLLKQNPVIGTKCDPSSKQIELDLLRTLPNNKHFESLESDGTCRLRRVLTAFSRHNPSVGYCQGLNRLAAVSLLFMPEEEAFWCLVAIVETIMPQDYYGRNLLGAHVDQYVLRHLLAEKLPRLHSHFEMHGIELSLFSWFLTAFVDNIPVKVYLRIWDVFLYEGSKVLFRFALAFLKMYEEEILKMKDSVSINQFLRTLGERYCDVKLLCNIAFIELNPFPYRTLKTKRIYHSRLVKEELEKLDELRRTLPNHDNSFDSQSD